MPCCRLAEASISHVSPRNCQLSPSAGLGTILMSSSQQAFGHGSRVFGLAFHPNSHDVIASASEDETVRVWGRDAGSGDWQQVRQQELCMISCRSPLVHTQVCFSTCLTLLHFTSQNSCCRGHTSEVLRVTWSPDGRLLASGGILLQATAVPACAGPVGKPNSLTHLPYGN